MEPGVENRAALGMLNQEAGNGKLVPAGLLVEDKLRIHLQPSADHRKYPNRHLLALHLPGGTRDGAIARTIPSGLVPGGTLCRFGLHAVELLQFGHHFARKQSEALFGVFDRHARVAENAAVVIGVHPLADLVDLVEAHFGRAPDLQVEEVIHRCVLAATLQVLGHLLVVLVALGLPEMIRRHLVVAQGGVPVAADVFDRHLVRAIDARVAERPARRYGRQRLAAIHLSVDGAVFVQLLRHRLPRLLRDNEDADPEFCHDARGFRRHRGGIGSALEALERFWPNIAPGLLDELSIVFYVTLLEAFEDHLRILDEALAGLAHLDAKALVFNSRETSAQAENHPTVRHVVNDRDLLCHADGVMPWQHHD